jgi:hypothetical protein
MPCVAAPGHRRGPAPARSHSRTRPWRLTALAQLCTLAHTRPSWRGLGRTFGYFSLAPDLATILRPCWSRRHGLAMENCLAHTAAGEWSTLLGLSRARLTADPCAHPHASVPGRGFHVRRRPFCAGPSSAASYSTPPLCGQLRAQARAARTSTPVRTQAQARARMFTPNTGAGLRCRVPQPRRRRRADHGADLAAPVASFLVSPSDPRGSREARHGACARHCETSPAARPSRAAVPLGPSVEHLGVTNGTVGFLCTRWTTCGCGRSQSAGIQCGPPLIP